MCPNTLKTSPSHATGHGVGPPHYRLVERYSKNPAGKGGEETNGDWCNDPRELGQLPQSRREQDKQLCLWPSGVLHDSFQLADKELVIIKGDNVLSKPPILDNSALASCNHEESDSHTMLHAAHAAHNGHKKIFIQR